ncbi:MAG TPA: hypothetical protein VFX22_08025 [Candidatus Kapabacteria bacterium]|nr:hypothetical protein [Candidatus Kapabacteria bacterium]
MQRAYRHSPDTHSNGKSAKKRAPVPSRQHVSAHEEKKKAPIFNTEFAGKPLKYVRPFDPVWPVEKN